MPNFPIDPVVEAYFNTLFQSVDYTDRGEARLGVDETTNPTLDASGNSAGTGYVWVRRAPAFRAISRALYMSTVNPFIPNLRVEVGINKQGDLVVIRPVVDTAAVGELGAALPAAGSAPLPAEVQTQPIPTRLQGGGRIVPTGDGLSVTVDPFAYDGGTVDAPVTFTLTPTATASKKAWVAISFNPATEGFEQDLSTDRSLAVQLLPDEADDSVPTGNIPLWAFGLANGATTIDADTQQVDLRLRNGVKGGTPTLTVTDGSTTVTDVTSITFNPNTVTDDGGGAISVDNGSSGGSNAFLYAPILLDRQTPTGTSVTFTIPTEYDHFEVRIIGASDDANPYDGISLQANSDTTAGNYRGQYLQVATSTTQGETTSRTIGYMLAGSLTGDPFSIFKMTFGDVESTSRNKTFKGESDFGNATYYAAIDEHNIVWQSTAALTGVTLALAAGNFVSGSIAVLIGWKSQGVGGAAVSTDNVSSPPTAAELVTAFGTAATVGAGYIGMVDDNNAHTTVYICLSDGTNWHYAAMTQAT